MEENYKLAKWLSGEMTQDELKAFESETDFVIYQKIKHYSATLESPPFDGQEMLSKVTNEPKKSKKTISLYQTWFVRIAAVILLVFGLQFLFKTYTVSTEYAQNGMQTNFQLPDKSEVVLNSGSEIKYKKWDWDNNRTLELNGEAYFKVAKGKKFEVNTSLGKVTVLGTQFNVKQRGDRFDVSCYEGKVRVNYNSTEQIITKGMSLSFQGGKPIAVPANFEQSPEWLRHEMVFYQADLISILNEFERQFNISLELKATDNPQLFTGTIPSESLDTALQVLSTSYHLKTVKISKDKIILTAINAQK